MKWKNIDGYSDMYAVSDTGLVKNIITGRQLATFSNHGYDRVNLYERDVNGKRKLVHPLVHNLVANAFLTRPDGTTEIDHINGCRNDNRVENLRWCTHTENMNNEISRENLRKSAQIINRTPEYRKKQSEAHAYKKKPVLCIETLQVFPSGREAARELGIPYGAVWNSCKRAEQGKLVVPDQYDPDKLHFMYATKD